MASESSTFENYLCHIATDRNNYHIETHLDISHNLILARPLAMPAHDPNFDPLIATFVTLRCCRPEVTIPSDRLAGGDRTGGLHRFLDEG